ncbi:MAG: SDR family NAD(P)-dependent oxidoreductase [Ardenticatenaceae bacterium]|nr:SDR family NAD(P)-dependent oxidoreductase [Anaerolineales bacterium]MCB8920441.1 SDR family NAD(P)-dependent oxidoreductase [Ardenticatenaceae bacterium]MCB8989396.1 SDR family NAD(P)-dependent oxidoreductase [Ardenticatenaceae bacterium]MCB9004551.1 SDR family NAD(P)-dependent oxidoreductase [Ardenticatenaceae bacterium]
MFAQKTILITGATDGIGLALARHYAAQGHRLILVGRRSVGPELGPQAAYCRADLAQADAAGRVTAFLEAQNITQLDLLVHNAGVGYYGRFPAQPAASIDALTAVNLRAPIALTHALLPWLRRARGQLVFVSSVASALPAPDYAVYAATKAALDGFARSLRVELRGQVTVQTIFPGATRTGMHAKMGIDRAVMDWEKFPSAKKTAVRMAALIARKRPFSAIGMSNTLLRFAGLRLGWLVDPLMRKGRSAAQPHLAHPQLCVITGAADGIGRALAQRFAQAGYRIIGVDIDAARAAQTQAAFAAQGADISFILADLATPQGVETAVAALQAGPDIDLFIHNAGINAVGQFARLPWPRQETVLRLNLLAPLHLTHGLLRANKLRSGGAWVFISSLSHYVGYPGAAVYAASKDGLASFARSLRVGSGEQFHMLTVFPGPTRTAHARRYSPDNSREATRMSPDELATAVFRAVQRRRALLIPGAGNRLFALAGRLAPRLMDGAMRKTILQKVGDAVFLEGDDV